VCASFQDELGRLSNPTVAATISKETSRLAASLAPILSAASLEERRRLLELFFRTVLDEVQAKSRCPERMPFDQMPEGTSTAVAATDMGSPNSWEVKMPVPAEIVEQALRDFDDKSTVEELIRIRETGGFTLDDFYQELENLIHPHK